MNQQVLRLLTWWILSLCLVLSMWHYVNNVWGANHPPYFSDLYAEWWATHEVFLHRRNPYTPGVAHEIQTVIYGAAVSGIRPGAPADIAGGFAYPLYVAFLLSPTLHMPFPAVQTMAIFLFLALSLISVLLWLYVMGWPFNTFKTFLIAAFAVGSFPALEGIRLQNLSILAAFLVACAVASITAERLGLAGALLAVATIKPQFVLLLIPWLAIWVVGDWARRQNLIWGFSATMFLLVFASEVLIPGWIRDFVKVIRAYTHYTYGHSLVDVWFRRRWGPVAASIIILIVLSLCWRHRISRSKSPRFFLITSLVLAATVTVIPTLAPHCQLLLLPGFLFLVQYRRNIWQSGRIARLLLVAAWVLPGWSWFAASAMTLAAFRIPPSDLKPLWMIPLYTSPLIPAGILTVLGFLFTRPAQILAQPIE